MSRTRSDTLLLLAFVLSGGASLGYEILWTRLLPLALGTEAHAVIGVLVGFFAGMAIGALFLDGWIRRSAAPVRWFVGLELVAAAYAVVSPAWLQFLSHVLPRTLGTAFLETAPQALGLSIGVSAVSLLPGTVPMGATLACLVEARRRARRDDSRGRGVGRLYAANTLGATLGILITVHLLLPHSGMAQAAWILAACGGAAAALAALWAHGRPQELVPEAKRARRRESIPVRRLYWVLAATGFVGIGLEVVCVQVLAQIFANTVFTFANLLAVYLIGTSVGSWVYSRYAGAAAGGRRASVAAGLVLAHVAAVVGAAWALWLSRDTLGALLAGRTGYAAHGIAELGVAATVFLIPTCLMGALFAHLVGWAAPRGVGRAYAVNTFGAALAPPVVSLWWMPRLPYDAVVLVHGVLYALVFTFLVLAWRLGRGWFVPGLVAAAALASMLPPSLGLVPVPRDWEVIARSEGPYGSILVTEQRSSGARRLQVNQRYRMGGSRDLVAKRLGQVPLLLAPEAKRALFLGIGTGATLAAVRSFEGLRADAVELVPEIVEYLPLFDEINDRVYEDPNVRVYVADARRFLAGSREKYDVIVADLFHPARDGAASLFSREHFALAREHLTEDGLFAQLVPTHQVDVPVLRLLVRTFVNVFPDAYSFLGIYNAKTPIVILVGTREGPLRISVPWLQEQLARPEYELLELADPRDLFGAALLDSGALRAWAGAGPINTDLRPHVLFEAPRVVYEKRTGLGAANLAALLPHCSPPSRLLEEQRADAADAFRVSVSAYAKAVRHYLKAELIREQERAGLSKAALGQYLEAYELAPRFIPARAMLIGIAQRNPTAAPAILRTLRRHEPHDSDLFRVLDGAARAGG